MIMLIYIILNNILKKINIILIYIILYKVLY